MAGSGSELIKRRVKRVSAIAALGLTIAASAVPAQAAPSSSVPGYAHSTAAHLQGPADNQHAGGDTGHRVH